MVSTTSPRKPQHAPWTVVASASGVPYDDQALLDNLEYALRVGGPATSRFLGEAGNVEGITRAITKIVPSLSSPDAKLRAGKLLNAVVDYSINAPSEVAYKALISGVGSGLFDSFLTIAEHPDRAIAASYLQATGCALGSRALAAVVEESTFGTILDAQKIRYTAAVCKILSTVSTTGGGSEVAPAAAASARPEGQIPIVAGINPGLGASSATSETEKLLNAVLSGLAAFLARDGNRSAFCGPEAAAAANMKPVGVLAGLLTKEAGLPIQVYYQSSFCLWLLSFSGAANPNSTAAVTVAGAMSEANVPWRLTHVLREISAEKVIRVSLSTLRNLMKMSVALRKDMVAAGLVGALESLCLLHWDDEDIRDDLAVLADALESEHASMSTFDVYRAEVLSGALEWSPPHRDETFWQENVHKLESNNLEVLRCIVRVLNESTDNTVLSVACHDLAQFVRHHPRGRQIAQSLGVKGRLMELMATGEGDVRRYALNGVQVLMITHWNLMQRSV